jgi:hypothetical protein
VKFVYYYRISEEVRIQPIVDNDETAGAYNLGTPALAWEPLALQAFVEGDTVSTELRRYSPGYGGLLSAVAPVFDEAGSVVAVAGVDIPDERPVKALNHLMALSAALLASLAVLITAGFVNFLAYKKKALA